MLRVTKIRMEYLEHPVGVGGLPWFSWVLESNRKNVLQKAYQLQIAKEPQFEQLIYDSGFVESSESVHVEVPVKGESNDAVKSGSLSFAGKIHSCTEYFVRVRVSDGVEESPYSETASFVTAILDKDQWQADFISGEEETDSANSGSTCLRKQIFLEGDVESAYVCTTALGLYRFFINGEKAGRMK